MQTTAGGACSDGSGDGRGAIGSGRGGRCSVQVRVVPGGGACNRQGRAGRDRRRRQAERAGGGMMDGGACRPIGATRRNWRRDSGLPAAYPFPLYILLESGRRHVRRYGASLRFGRNGMAAVRPLVGVALTLRSAAPHCAAPVGCRVGLGAYRTETVERRRVLSICSAGRASGPYESVPAGLGRAATAPWGTFGGRGRGLDGGDGCAARSIWRAWVPRVGA